MNTNFVLVRALRGDKAGEAIFRKFKVESTPTLLIFGRDGALVDWHCGYNPPPEDFLARLENSVKGIETVKSLEEAYAKDARNIDIVFKLARKFEDRYGMYDPESSPKVVKLFREALALDPDGKTGTTEFEKKSVPFTEYAEYILGYAAFASPERDVKPLRAFIKKYPQSPMLRMAYMYVGAQFSYQGSKEDAQEFFEEYIAAYPDDPNVLHQYVQRIIRDKEPLDRGFELAKKISSILKANTDPRYVKSLAELHLLKGDAKEAEKTYGPAYMDSRALMFAMNSMDYAEFWFKQKKNEASALAMIDAALKIQPDYWYISQRAAQIFINQANEAKALEIYGPSFAKKNWDMPSPLFSYAVFWARQGKNLDSALEAAKRVVEKDAFQAYNWDGLAQVSLKLKKYDEAIRAEEEAIKLAEGSAVEVFKKRLEAIRKAKAEGK